MVETIRFLSARGLAFHGSDEVVGSSRNGNYLGILELLAKFDPFLAQHINHNKGRRATLMACPSTNKNSDFILQGYPIDRLVSEAISIFSPT